MYRSSWVEISKAALRQNSAAYRTLVGQRPLAAVIKSNAYGHGMVEIAQFLQAESLADWLCVATGSEAVTLRSAGVTLPILVLSYVDVPYHELIDQEIDMVIYDLTLIDELRRSARKCGKQALIHLKVDTGLSRLGLEPEIIYQFLVTQGTTLAPEINLRGLFTHLADPEPASNSFAREQLAKFETLVHALGQQGIQVPFRHTSSTGAVDAGLMTNDTLCRVGLGLYGLWPSEAHRSWALLQESSVHLEPALRWKTRIAQLKEVSAGSSVGYGRTYIAAQRMILAIIPVGYWEGYRRELSSQGHVLIHKQVAPVVGRVSMNLIAVNVTAVANVQQGDEVTLISGEHPAVHPQTIAEQLGTISWEVITGINPLIPRHYVGE